MVVYPRSSDPPASNTAIVGLAALRDRHVVIEARVHIHRYVLAPDRKSVAMDTRTPHTPPIVSSGARSIKAAPRSAASSARTKAPPHRNSHHA